MRARGILVEEVKGLERQPEMLEGYVRGSECLGRLVASMVCTLTQRDWKILSAVSGANSELRPYIPNDYHHAVSGHKRGVGPGDMSYPLGDDTGRNTGHSVDCSLRLEMRKTRL
jgi:hypothetical protein